MHKAQKFSTSAFGNVYLIIMKQLLVLVAVFGLAAGFSSYSRSSRTAERTLQNGKNKLKEDENFSPISEGENGLVEVSEDEIPDGVMVFVMDESELPKTRGETMATADNIVFRPLFQYRNRQEALARRRAPNGFRRRYFVQRRPNRNTSFPSNPYRYA